MIEWIFETLRGKPELVIFLTLALGYLLGKLKLGSFSLGSVTGTLLAGLLIGQIGIEISGQVKSIFFTMFLFAVGYSVGPQFVRGVARDGAPQAIFAVVISVLCLICVWLAAKIAGYDVGFAAGLLAGSQTISASIGLATDAINGSGIANPKNVLNNIPVAYAVTYIWGTIGTGLILSVLGPKILRIDLVEECKRYEAEMSQGAPAGGMASVWQQFQIRAFRVDAGLPGVGKTIGEIEQLNKASRLYAERIRRDGKIIDFDANTVLKAGDVVAVSGRPEMLVALQDRVREVSDAELLDIPVEAVDLVVTNKKVDGRTLIDLAKEDFVRGVYLEKITRGATSIDVPILAQTVINRADILRIVGRKTHVRAHRKSPGLRRPPLRTDRHGLGWLLYRRLRPYRGADLQGRRGSAHAVDIWRRPHRGLGSGLVARGVPDLRSPARAHPVVHELGGFERVHRDRRHLGRPGIHQWPQVGGNLALFVGGLRHFGADAARSADRQVHLQVRPSHQPGLLRGRPHQHRLGRDGRRRRQEQRSHARIHGALRRE